MYIRLITGKLLIVSQPIKPIIDCRIFQPITITSHNAQHHLGQSED